jgi:hypothetical protein
MAKKRRLDTLSPLIASIAILAANPVSASGTWTGFTNQPPAGFSNCLLLTDGTVMCAVGGGSGGNTWYKLTPDSSGSYTNGTWSQLASMNDTRLYYSSEVLPNGNVYVAGGEYGTGGSDARAEIYNPLTNSWSFSSTMPFTATDASAILLPNGNILQSNSQSTYAQYNPNNNSWSGTFGGPDSNETDWVQLPDSSILELVSYGQNTSRYIPSSNSWVNDATVPVALFGYGGELGSAHLLPNGNVFWLGATSNTAIYTPSGNTNPGSWVAGPQIPGGFGAVDSAAAMMANGNILCAVGSTSGFSAPTYFYEYNYTTNSFSQVNGPTGTSDNTSPFTTSMLALPDGGILYQGTGLYEYKPNGSQVSSGAPSVQSITHNSDGSYTLTGTGLDGISEGAKYGDDKQMNSNYPLVRITNNSTGTVYYCRTYNWTPGLVMTGSRTMSTQFAVPSSAPNGSYTLVVSANGIASSGVSFALGSGIVPNGIHTLTPQCSTGSRLDDSGGGTTNGNKIQIWAAATTANQQWNFTSIGGNTYNIAVNLGPYCLDSNGGAAGTAVHLWTCGGYANQQWTVSSVSGGYELVNSAGNCLDDTNYGTNNGNTVQSWTCGGNSAQTWMVDYTPPLIANGVHTLTPQCATGSRLDDAGGGTTNGNTIQIWQAAGNVNQQWNFSNIGGNTYNIAVNLGPYCLDANGGASGTAVHLWSCGGYDNQKWTAITASGGFQFQSPAGTCLDVTGANSANGTVVQNWTCSSSDNAQIWAVN